MSRELTDGLARSVTAMRALEAACASAAGNVESRVGRALEHLRPVTGFEMASLSYWDAKLGTHRNLTNHGYPDQVVILCDSIMHDDSTFLALRAERVPSRLRDLPPESLTGVVSTQIIRKNRFRDGLTHCYFSSTGDYLGYINLTANTSDLLDASTHIVQLIEPAVASVLSTVVQRSERDADAALRLLTARELDVLALLPSGATNDQIAAQLCVARTTVARHIEHIITKLGVPNRTRAACVAVEQGISPTRGGAAEATPLSAACHRSASAPLIRR